jgi:NAD(P)-dependent dehydrogenase (short-subunit alcohol dehydrogenase family)
MDLELRGKRAIVTGGGAGIGRAIATELAREGADVAITGRRPEVLKEAAAQIETETGKAVAAVAADTGSDESVQALVSEVVASFGGIDILANVASENPAQPGGPSYVHATDDQFIRQLNVKVLGYLRTTRAVAPYLIEQRWGRIINVSGIGVRRTGPVINSVRNAGVTALSKSLADELGPHGINVTVLYPGHTLSNTYEQRLAGEAAERGMDLPDYLATIDTGTALGRFVRPEEIGWVAAFLASPKSITISGDVITVGGGFLGATYY